MEDKMLKLVKEEMAGTITLLGLDNLQVSVEIINKHIELLKNINELHQIKKETAVLYEEKEVKEDITLEESQGTGGLAEIPAAPGMAAERQTYLFRRELRGGVVEGVNGYVPEKVVRMLDLEHGDKVYATPKESPDPNKQFFLYELAEKGEGKANSNRIQYNYCPVIKQAGRLVVEQSMETGNIRYNESLFTVLISEKDIMELKIREGDLIDIAFPKDNIDLAHAIWVHPLEEKTPEQWVKNKKPKKQHDKEGTEASPELEQTLAGKSILVIGNESKRNLYSDIIEKRGGEFLSGDTKERLERLEAKIRKSSLVIFLLGVSGHIGMEHIKKMCKEYNKPFETSWSTGLSSIVKIAEEKAV